MKREKISIKDEINKLLTEKMGLCFHKITHDGDGSYVYGWECNKCGTSWTKGTKYPVRPQNTDFFTWEGFGILYPWAIQQEWFNKFIDSLGWNSVVQYKGASLCKEASCFGREVKPIILNYLEVNFINPSKFTPALYKFLKEQENGYDIQDGKTVQEE